MAVNGTEFVNEPIDTIFGTFTRLLGSPYYIILIFVIGIALIIRTKDPTIFGLYLIAAAVFLGTANIFVHVTGIIPLFIVLIAAGFTSLFVGYILDVGR